jgi:hypothetical protein
MANPNIVDVTAIYGNTAATNVTTTAATLVSNQSASNAVVKVNSVVVSNSNITTNQSVTLRLSRNGTDYSIMSNVTVPYAASIVLISKDIGLYLVEGDTCSIIGTSDSDMQAVCSYEVIS